ncbi:MAG TPA: hypothetical protein VF903_11200 [Nitrospirota bacterium]
MTLKDIEKKAFDEYNKTHPDPKPDLITKIAYWIAGLFFIGFIVWKFAVPLLGFAGLIIEGVGSVLDFLFSWKTMLLLALLFIAVVLNDIRRILIDILRSLND